MKPSHSYFSLKPAAAAAIVLLVTVVPAHSQSVVTSGQDDAKSKRQGSQFHASESEIRRVQSALRGLGYYSGAVDGFIGQKTQVAIAKFQVDHHLPVRAQITPALLVSLGLERRPPNARRDRSAG
jgi:peptidoglycan hydrolase-like protein with peptidoglycan-binding domain